MSGFLNCKQQKSVTAERTLGQVQNPWEAGDPSLGVLQPAESPPNRPQIGSHQGTIRPLSAPRAQMVLNDPGHWKPVPPSAKRSPGGPASDASVHQSLGQSYLAGGLWGVYVPILLQGNWENGVWCLVLSWDPPREGGTFQIQGKII